ncbi:hypothetical protein HF576_01485 [Microbacterium sp. CFH 90308]|uniref:Uncharacterized protein n=1 Tax=Microbacterium salsuginis TaxID=2722803 RepID=A0ABX1K7X6_9MICO|nr:hypothetical protein [Microbacterium sp. CFH 90308]NLP82510.1 hypothetical protein [Microbacterium sp. CFH 90308]
MSHLDPPPHPASPPMPARGRISWASVIGFGTLGLLWPVLRLVRLDAVIGDTGTALVALVATLLVWILGAGFGDVPRPVLTLTLSGVLSGALVIATTVLVGEWPDYGVGLNVTAGGIEVARAAGLGALAGAIATPIQRTRRRRA